MELVVHDWKYQRPSINLPKLFNFILNVSVINKKMNFHLVLRWKQHFRKNHLMFLQLFRHFVMNNFIFSVSFILALLVSILEKRTFTVFQNNLLSETNFEFKLLKFFFSFFFYIIYYNNSFAFCMLLENGCLLLWNKPSQVKIFS